MQQPSSHYAVLAAEIPTLAWQLLRPAEQEALVEYLEETHQEDTDESVEPECA